MSTEAVADQTVRLTLDVLERLFTGGTTEQVGVRLWDGTCWPDEAPRPAVLVLKHPGALRAMLLPGTEVGMGEAYLYDDFDIEGDAEAVFRLADLLSNTRLGWRRKLRAGTDLTQLPRVKHRDALAGPRRARRGPARLSGRKHSVE